MQILNLDIEHHGDYPWQFVEGKNCCLQIRSSMPLKKITVVYGDPFLFKDDESKEPVLNRMEIVDKQSFGENDYYSAKVPMATHKLRYHFEITVDDYDECIVVSESGVTEKITEEQMRPFMVPFVFEKEHYSAPEWADNLVWYQVFPDRFHNGKEDAESSAFQPGRDNFFGGTIKGILSKIPYLKELGIDGIYLNPIFQSNSNHRYDAVDYFSIDARLGTEEDFKRLVEEVHRNQMKIMLDGVYNHCGWNHPFFQDVIRNGKKSPYYHWFYIYDQEALTQRELSEFTKERMITEPAFESFAFAANMPKWNTENEEVTDYLVKAAVKWTREYQIDAWRLDVPDEVNSGFLSVFRERLRECREDIYVIGEIWQYADRWLERALFDGVMDYPLYYAIRDFAMLKVDRTDIFAKRMERWYRSIPKPVHSHQWTFCSNHDIPRAMFLCENSFKSVEKAYFLTALSGGNLCIYYGDEIGMEGGGDPDNRRPMDWERTKTAEKQLEFFKNLIRFKHEYGKEFKLTGIKVMEAGYLQFSDQSNELLAIVAESYEPVTVKPEGRYQCLFGRTMETENGWIVWDYAAFRKKL